MTSVSAFPYGVLSGAGIVPVSVSATDVTRSISGFASSGRVPASGNASTSTTVSGGVGPFTYSWVKQTDATGDAFVISSSTAQSPGWYGPNRPDGAADDTETWKVTVTDTGDGGKTATDIISVTLTWTNIS